MAQSLQSAERKRHRLCIFAPGKTSADLHEAIMQDLGHAPRRIARDYGDYFSRDWFNVTISEVRDRLELYCTFLKERREWRAYIRD